MISPHGTEHLHGTQDIPHGTHDTPHGTEHPPWYWAPPTVLSTPHGTEHPPRYCTHIIQGEGPIWNSPIFLTQGGFNDTSLEIFSCLGLRTTK